MGGNLVLAKAGKGVKNIVIEKTKRPNYSFDFESGSDGFDAIFADYHDDGNNFETYQMQSKYGTIPVEGVRSKGIYVASVNRSDDMFMGFVKELSGYEKNKAYTFKIKFKLATSVDAGMSGIGGSPGSSVAIKTGVVSEKPDVKPDQDGIFRFTNVDSGSQLNEGKDLKLVGNMEKPEDAPYGFAFKDCSATVTATASDEGKVYLVIGSDSGFEGFTEYYIDDVTVNVK